MSQKIILYNIRFSLSQLSHTVRIFKYFNDWQSNLWEPETNSNIKNVCWKIQHVVLVMTYKEHELITWTKKSVWKARNPTTSIHFWKKYMQGFKKIKTCRGKLKIQNNGNTKIFDEYYGIWE